jgi:Xaa-Pro aminopeptidase
VKKRIDKCVREIKKSGLDSLLISKPDNITYLTGFRAGDGYLLITKSGELIYFTHFIYEKEAKSLDLWKVLVSNGDIFKLIKVKIKNLKLSKVGFEAKNIPYLEYAKIKEYLSKDRIEFNPAIDLIEKLRAIKSAKEISLIRKAVEVSQEAFDFVREIYDQIATEKDLSIEIEKFLRLKGDNSIAFPPIVASGKNTAYPHYLASEEGLNNRLFLVDLGAKYQGYCADLTRVFFWGKMPNLFRKVYDIVKKAADAGIKKVKEGVKISEVDRAARDVIEKQGYGKYFGHGTGHGIGLSVHESPYINSRNENILKQGMVLTIEPAVYIEGKFGIRIEDMVLVKKHGVEVLNGNAYR